MNDTRTAAIGWQPVRCCIETDTMAVEIRPCLARRTMTALRAMPVSISSSISLRMASDGCGKSSAPHTTRNTSPPRLQSCAGRALRREACSSDSLLQTHSDPG
jgi:hypothetical protein